MNKLANKALDRMQTTPRFVCTAQLGRFAAANATFLQLRRTLGCRIC